ncbi:hypothetical protein VI03_30085 [Burkholderia vietnamiensis]|nr:hypothetical protein VI03_30085 [Burkholderia vietnamiensis]
MVNDQTIDQGTQRGWIDRKSQHTRRRFMHQHAHQRIGRTLHENQYIQPVLAQTNGQFFTP